MTGFFGDMKKILTDLRVSVPVIVTSLLSFGWQLIRFNIGIDDLVRDRYLGGGLFSQGRFSSPIVSYSFGFFKAFPFFEPFLGVLFLTAAAFLLICLFQKASKGVFSRGVLTFFACIFVSYPLTNELFVYKGSDLYLGVGYFLAALSLVIVSGIFRKDGVPGETDAKRSQVESICLRLLFSTLIWIFLVSLYEALAAVYLVLVSLYLFTEVMTGEKRAGKETGDKNPGYIRKYFVFLAPAVLGIVLEYLLGLLLTSIIKPAVTIPAGSGIYIPETFSAEYFVNMFYQMFRKLFLAGLWYYPVALFAVSVLIALVVFTVTGISKRRASVILFALGTFAGLFGLGILTGGSVKYRTCLSFAPFVAFCVTLLIYYSVRGLRENRGLHIAIQVCAAVIILTQVVSINLCFYNNDLRWQEEKAVLTDCGEALKDFGDKPVIFIGEYTLSDNILSRKYVTADDPLYKAVKKAANGIGFDLETNDLSDRYVLATCQSDFGSVISWGIHDRYGCNEELHRVFNYIGYEFTPGTLERYDELTSSIESFPAFNETGIVTELDDCVVVRFK